MQDPESSYHHSSPDEANGEPKKRQRIQQACKSCGIKRVKCDGQLPCITCVRTGDHCEYGMPKKRGPPKGSSRAPSKNSARFLPPQQRPNASQWSSTAPSPLAPPSHQHPAYASAPAEGEAAGPSHRPHPPPGLDRRHAALQAQSPHSFAPSPPRSAPVHGPGMPRPSMPPPPDLPRAPGLLLDPYRGSYVSLPHPSGSSRPKFRGGSSGILDFPSSRESSFLRHSSMGSQYADTASLPAGRTSPSSFVLKRPQAIEDSALRAGVADHFPDSGRFTPDLAAIRSSVDRPALRDGDTTKSPPGRSNDVVRSRAPEDVIAESILPSFDVASNTISGSQETTPPELQEPRIPATIEDGVWKLFWRFPGMHWPILMKKNLPLMRGIRRVDGDRQPLLYNAAMALASRIWDVNRDGPLSPLTLRAGQSPTVPTSAEISDVYFLRARYWLTRTDHEPTVETAQALLFMSLQEGGGGRSSQSAQYAMAACRVAFDIGLHRNLGNRLLSGDELQERLRLWWGIYILDKTTAAMLGRPCVLRYAETDAPFFDIDELEESDGWATDGEPLAVAAPPAYERMVGQPCRALSHMLAGCKLAAICEDVILQYNLIRPKGDSRAFGPAEPWDAAVARLHGRLEEWQQSLPAHLKPQPRGPTLQHILCQQMWVCACRIILHRPYILKQSSIPDLPPSHKVCTDSANKLCDLVAVYRRDHGVRQISSTIVYCVFTAATILLANTTSPHPDAAHDAKLRLRECAENLGTIGGSWNNASVHLSILRHLGESLDADLTGTGLERDPRDGPDAIDRYRVTISDYSTQPGPGPGSIHGGALSSDHAASESSQSEDNSPSRDFTANGFGTREGGAASSDGRDGASLGYASAAASKARASLSEDRFYAINDENYWGQMPLSSENQEAWAMFTTRYLESLNSASIAATRLS